MKNTITLLHGDCLEVLKTLPDNSVDSIVTDPPYGLSFMGKRWDYDVPSVDVWAECLRVLKPGGHLLAFAGTRTQHRMAVRIEDAGFEIRDMIAWVYGSGFPKSLDVSKALDKMAGAEREVLGKAKKNGGASNGRNSASVGYVCETNEYDITAPATEAARQWQGWGTALKPALEPITVARKPLIGTVAANVLAHGTGGLNIDGCRVGTDLIQGGRAGLSGESTFNVCTGDKQPPHEGRWPANLIHDGSDEVLEQFPANRPGMSGGGKGKRDASMFGVGGVSKPEHFRCDTGSAARFFYCAKASKKDRDEGLEGFEKRMAASACARVSQLQGEEATCISNTKNPRANVHPTVKPTDLMRYLCRLVTPTGGVVLDPFMGSGSTGKAATIEGFDFIGIEMDENYFNIAKARIEDAEEKLGLFA